MLEQYTQLYWARRWVKLMQTEERAYGVRAGWFHNNPDSKQASPQMQAQINEAQFMVSLTDTQRQAVLEGTPREWIESFQPVALLSGVWIRNVVFLAQEKERDEGIADLGIRETVFDEDSGKRSIFLES